MAARPEAEHGFRPDIQGLRAIAVALVVVFHLYPGRLSGGYVGVDVFFVISGYLITEHLARTLARGQRVRLLDFYGRRARRLLPAAALVLTATAIGSWLWLPVTQRGEAAQQIRAAALYFENWRLAHNATDYFAREQAATPVEHFWSLSVEEQFYLVWPLLFVVAGAVGVWVARRVRAGAHHADDPQRAHRTALVTLFALTSAVVAASLAYSVVETAHRPAAAYFVTPTRMWELGLGGLLGLTPRTLTRRLRRVGLVSWAGFAAILVSAFTLSGATAFPGWVALVPVLGAAAMILCGSDEARVGTAWFTGSRPAVFLGDISYELYLWHWPLIVLWDAYQHDGTIGYLDGPVIVVVAVLLSWLTKKLVTDPVRRARVVVRRPAVSLATALAVIVPATLTTVFIAGQPGPWNGHVDANHPGAQAVAPVIATPVPGSGAVTSGSAAASSPSAPDPSATAVRPQSAGLVPPLTDAAKDLPLMNTNGCEVDVYDPTAKPCTVNNPAHPALKVAVVGDSHAAMWSSSLETIAKQHDWQLVGEIHSSCVWTSTLLNGRNDKPYTSCQQWGRTVLDQLVNDIKPDVVIVSGRDWLGTAAHPTADATSFAQTGEGMVPYVKTLTEHGIAVVAIHETPEPKRDIPDCLSTYHDSIPACSTPKAKALQTDTAIDVAHRELGAKLPVVTMDDLLCPGTTCPPAIGNVVVYVDTNHLTKTFTSTLTPYLERRLFATGVFS